MASRRKELKREIAKTGDPVIRAQLQNLLERNRKRQEGLLRRVEGALDTWTRQELSHLPAGTPMVLILIVLALIMLVVFLILESGA